MMPMDPSLMPQTSRVNWSTFPLCNETLDTYLKGGKGDRGSWFQMVSVCHGGEGVMELLMMAQKQRRIPQAGSNFPSVPRLTATSPTVPQG